MRNILLLIIVFVGTNGFVLSNTIQKKHPCESIGYQLVDRATLRSHHPKIKDCLRSIQGEVDVANTEINKSEEIAKSQNEKIHSMDSSSFGSILESSDFLSIATTNATRHLVNSEVSLNEAAHELSKLESFLSVNSNSNIPKDYKSTIIENHKDLSRQLALLQARVSKNRKEIASIARFSKSTLLHSSNLEASDSDDENKAFSNQVLNANNKSLDPAFDATRLSANTNNESSYTGRNFLGGVTTVNVGDEGSSVSSEYDILRYSKDDNTKSPYGIDGVYVFNSREFGEEQSGGNILGGETVMGVGIELNANILKPLNYVNPFRRK